VESQWQSHGADVSGWLQVVAGRNPVKRRKNTFLLRENAVC